VKFAPGSSLTDLLHLQDDLSQLLGRPVDVVSEAALKPRDGHILAEAIAI
jgi:predicted nucleotidyltransferase